ncbi:MAG: sulfatase [Bacteroidota bacterium]
MKYNIKLFNGAALLLASLSGCTSVSEQSDITPNIVLIFCDDMGYSDISPFGNPTINTPNLEKLAAEGQKWTNFYVASSVCTPSRAGLLTGRLAIRSGTESEPRRVFFPDSKGGLPHSEITIAQLLKEKGYSTACIGKWHLGHLPEYLPTNKGFDYYFGIPYSNDMDRIEEVEHYESCVNPKIEYFEVPLIENLEEIERPADQRNITKRYTQKALDFVNDNYKKPFFLYLNHTMPHVPLFRSEEFAGKSRAGVYGDVIEEIDWSTGEIIELLKEKGIEKNTLVIFTSDNGPWHIFNELAGTTGVFRGAKGGTFEGGYRVPAIFWWPETIKHRVVHEMASTLDFFPTFCSLTDIEMPSDREFDGFDLTNVILNNAESERQIIYYYRGSEIYAIRYGSYKAHFFTKDEYYEGELFKHDPPLLYNLDVDPGERFNVASEHPDIIDAIIQIREKHLESVVPGENQMNLRIEEEPDAMKESL